MLYGEDSQIQLLLACLTSWGRLHLSILHEQHNSLVPSRTSVMWASKKQREVTLVPNVERAGLPMLQLVFPEIEQDLSKRFSPGGQEKPSVAWCLISGDSDPHSWVPAHPSWVWLFSSHQAQQPDSLFASACCSASLFDFLGKPCPCPSSYVIYTQFQFLFWSWLGLGQTLLLVCRTPSVHLCSIWERWWFIFISTRGRTFFLELFSNLGNMPSCYQNSLEKSVPRVLVQPRLHQTCCIKKTPFLRLPILSQINPHSVYR